MATRSVSSTRLTEAVRTKLLHLRDLNQWTDVEWARAAQLDSSEVNRFARGKTLRIPSLDFLDALCRAFHLTLVDVLSDELPPASLSPAMQRYVNRLQSMDPQDRAALDRLIFRLGERANNNR